jgi:hypothetical protein
MRLDYKLLKNVYTLTAIYTIDYDKEWQKILNKQQYNLFEEHGEYILGYLVVHKPLPIGWEMVVDEVGKWEGDADSKCDYMMNDTPNYIHYIDAMDTRLRRYQLGAFMIKYYETLFSSGSYPNGCIACLPFKVDSSSVIYWRKYLEKHNVFTSDDVRYIIKQYGIYGIVDWELLIAEYDTYNVSIWRK